MKKTGRELNDAFAAVKEMLPEKGNSLAITKAIAYTEPRLKDFGGYTLSFSAHGEHTDINVMVPYKWVITNSVGTATVIDTQTSLTLGWNLPKVKVFEIA